MGNMGSKRKRESLQGKPKSKKQRSKTLKTSKSPTSLTATNKYAALSSHEDDSDSGLLFDFEQKREPDLVLLDKDDDDTDDKNTNKDISDRDELKDDDDVVIESDDSDDYSKEGVTEKVSDDQEGPKPKKRKFEANELARNLDFIELGFSSSEEDVDNYEEYSDDGRISNDGLGSTEVQSSRSSFPWIQDHDHSKQKEIADWLTLEMNDFVNYISPSKDEIMARNKVINLLKKQISSFWENTETHVFGSSATDLYLPGSDIDMVVISSTGDFEQRSRLYQLSSYLRNKKLAKNIEVIAKAKVPIIKFVDPSTGIHIDISFERSNGIDAAKKIRKWLASTPGLRELVLTVKQFLRSRKLNNVHVGGLGGYSTIILCYHFLKMHPRLATNNISISDNLGTLLIEFFELYGRNFSYDNLIIAIDSTTDLPKYLLKKDYPKLNTSKNPFTIIIQDPSDQANNISRSSYNLRDIKKAFGGAYQMLIDKCYQLNAASYKDRLGQLILGDIIKYRGKERDFNDDRDKVANDALINHEIKELLVKQAKSDELYFSDVSVATDDDTTFAEKSNSNEKKVADYLSLENLESESESNDSNDVDPKNEEEFESKKKSSVDKDVKRNYWHQKGIEI
ncbi:uncharacterized protein PRCAT00004439001 [Priceomyces carsonii]|uniref:uncharacterized protein n=1 Tax=Priceomyces carsonii TaxID=28549 RepID=UPI002EDACBA9|nr:unnamed protein product [Priceomyces carsonii]